MSRCTFGYSDRAKAPPSLFPSLALAEKAPNNGANSKKEQEQASVKALAFLFPLKEEKKIG